MKWMSYIHFKGSHKYKVEMQCFCYGLWHVSDVVLCHYKLSSFQVLQRNRWNVITNVTACISYRIVVEYDLVVSSAWNNLIKFYIHIINNGKFESKPCIWGSKYISSGTPEVLCSLERILWVFQRWVTSSNSIWIKCMKQNRNESLQEGIIIIPVAMIIDTQDIIYYIID